MKKATLLITTILSAGAAVAQDQRELEAHVHGHGALNIAFEGEILLMELETPGFDIVGFEYEAKTEEARAAVEDAIAKLGQPEMLFVLPDAAGCELAAVEVELHSGEHESHEDEDHDEAHHDDEHHDDEHHDDEDHDEAHHDDEHHDDADHDDEHHDDEHHDEAHHDDEHHDEAHHDDEHDGGAHSEFHATYQFSCSDITAVTGITFAYFDAFPNAEELEIQAVSDKGAGAFEASREAMSVDLSSLR